jgi:glycosyltransferase involved in cell wall biosynthesis
MGGGLHGSLYVVEECKKIDINTYHVFIGENAQKQINTNSFPKNFIFYRIPKVNYLQLHKYLKPLENQIKPDCVFTLRGPSYWKPNAPHVMGYAIPHFIYKDYKYIKYLPLFSKIWIHFQEIIKLDFFKRQADHLIVQTKDARLRLMKEINSTAISIVPNMYSSHYLKLKRSPNKLPYRKNDEVRLITISSYYPHKNIESIPKVLAELEKNGIVTVKFILTLKSDDYIKIIPERWRDRVYNTGPVAGIECPSLYQECDMLYLPTLLEVFSASYPEAMIMGKPILTSDLSFARDICGDAALYFDPFNTSSIAETIKKIAFNRNVYQEYVNKGNERVKIFPTAAQRAEISLEICQKVVDKNHFE